jgi:hypothetical protein
MGRRRHRTCCRFWRRRPTKTHVILMTQRRSSKHPAMGQKAVELRRRLPDEALTIAAYGLLRAGNRLPICRLNTVQNGTTGPPPAVI